MLTHIDKTDITSYGVPATKYFQLGAYGQIYINLGVLVKMLENCSIGERHHLASLPECVIMAFRDCAASSLPPSSKSERISMMLEKVTFLDFGSH